MLRCGNFLRANLLLKMKMKPLSLNEEKIVYRNNSKKCDIH
jgi:hypothetical protein